MHDRVKKVNWLDDNRDFKYPRPLT